MNAEKQELLQLLEAGLTNLTRKQAAVYLGLKLSTIYRLTYERRIPFYKPNGKTCYFKRADLDAWIEANRIAPMSEMTDRAQAYCQGMR